MSLWQSIGSHCRGRFAIDAQATDDGGGRVGLQVGDTLRRVAKEHQVFAISHLPQIAARAHHHIVVAKGAKGGVTTADISVLQGTSRVNEIARMLGGDPESKVSRAHAKELLESAAVPA